MTQPEGPNLAVWDERAETGGCWQHQEKDSFLQRVARWSEAG